ncbi:WH2 domain-containing protein [Balamuthia mandrillaris]
MQAASSLLPFSRSVATRSAGAALVAAPNGLARGSLCAVVVPSGPVHQSRRGYALKSGSDAYYLDSNRPPNDEKPVPAFLERDKAKMLDVFNVEIPFRWGQTPHLRETPATARRRANRRRLTEIRKRAFDYVQDTLSREAERFRQEREQIERWKQIRREQKLSRWLVKMRHQEEVDREVRQEIEQHKQRKLRMWQLRQEEQHKARLEFLRALEEEKDRFELTDLPKMLELKNQRYATWMSMPWFREENS